MQVSRVAAVLLRALLLGLARAQLKILAPKELALSFQETHGVVYGTTATFGAPTYGERVLGQLLYGESSGRSHCTSDDYSLPQATRTSTQESSQEVLVDIFLVKRGGCTFVTKVKVAQEKNAHAVVVVDKDDSDLTSEQIQKIVMADDGWGHQVKIPSLLVSRFDGQKLIDAARQGPVVVELAWDIPRGEVVVADFWMSAGSRESSEFLERFKDCAETLKYRMQFVPRYHIFSLPEGAALNRLCMRAVDGCVACQPQRGRFCAPDPDGPGPITGADVANEDLRQLCIWNITARRVSRTGARYSQEFWDYATKFADDCLLEEGNFNYECSSKVMRQVGISVEEVTECAARNFERFLEDQIEQVAWSPQALRLNGWRYSGPLDPEYVLKAVCSGYAVQPHECQELLSGYEGGVTRWAAPSLTLQGLISAIAVMGCVLVAVFFLYKRHVTQSVRRVLREEVMLEVQTQMADYVPFEDSGERRGGRTLAF